MISLKLWLVDAFTSVAFKGNPAGVCVVEEFPPKELMQQIAAELHWSETAFVKKLPSPSDYPLYHIRWFSPEDEAPLCGHATLAAAHILWREGFCQAPLIRFESLGGELKTILNEDGWITLDFPRKNVLPCPMPENLQEALGDVTIESVLKDDLIYLVVLSAPEEVIHAQPNLALIENLNCRAVTITAQSKEPYNFVSRYFAPRVGIPEDPVCGSAHCRLVPYWGEVLGLREMIAYQASARGGLIKTRYDINRVYLTAEATTICEGFLALPEHYFNQIPERKKAS